MLEKCYLPKRTLATPTLGGVLYLVPDCSQDELIRLILGECRGIPEYYDILFCTEDSTEEEIQSFMKRVEVSSQRHMLILEVNNLPYSLQEVRSTPHNFPCTFSVNFFGEILCVTKYTL